MYVRRSTAAQYAATKVTTSTRFNVRATKYPIQRSGAASIGFLTARARFEPRLLQFGYVRWAATFG
jgi:hypothetical protein